MFLDVEFALLRGRQGDQEERTQGPLECPGTKEASKGLEHILLK